MIDPCDCIKFDRTDEELEEFFLYCVFAANKNSDRTAKSLDFILRQRPGMTPFAAIRDMFVTGDLMNVLVASKCGEYTRRFKSMSEIAGGLVPNLRTALPEELEVITGVGRKTSRLFIMFTRENVQYAALDVHILRYLRDNTSAEVPRKTPTNPDEYRRLEKEFLFRAYLAGEHPAEFDLKIWTQYSGREGVAA